MLRYLHVISFRFSLLILSFTHWNIIGVCLIDQSPLIFNFIDSLIDLFCPFHIICLHTSPFRCHPFFYHSLVLFLASGGKGIWMDGRCM
jgi:hypothetical protein